MGSDTSNGGMHVSPENITTGSPQEGMRTLVPGRRGHGFRVHTARQPRFESLDAPAMSHLPLFMGAGNVPSVRSKRAREAYRSHSRAPRSSTAGRHRSSRPQFPPAPNPERNYPCNRTPSPTRSTGHGAPGAVACLRLRQNQTSRPTLSLDTNAAVAPMYEHVRAARGESAGEALRAVRRGVRVGGVILRSAGCTLRSKTERHDLRSWGCEG